MAPTASSKRTLLIVFFTVFLDLIGFGIIIPIQPFFAEKLGAAPHIITLLGASFSLMQFLFAHFWGRLSDRIGRKPVMLISIATTAIGYGLFGLAGSLPMLFFARMLAGFGGANIGAAQAIIADSTDSKNRAKGMGLIGAAFGLGFIFGPALGGLFGQFGLSAPAFAAAFLSTLNWIFALFYLPETNLPENRGKSQTSHGFSWAALKHASRHHNVPQIFLVYLIYSISFSMMEQGIGLFIAHTWVESVLSIGAELHAKKAAALTSYMLIVVGVTATIVQGGLIGKLAKVFEERKLLVTGLCLITVTLFSLPFIGMSKMYSLLLVNSVFMALGTGLTNPSLSSLLSQSVDTGEQGGALGIGQSLAGLGRVIGPSMSGALFEYYAGAPFWVGALVMALGAIVALSVRAKPVS